MNKKFKNLNSLYFIFSIIIAMNTVGFAENKIVHTNKIDKHNISIDGIIDEKIWSDQIFQGEFIQHEPVEGAKPSENTEFAILYDNFNIYVAIKAYASQPERIKAILSRRDIETPSDWVSISFDSYNDNRTAFEFWLNPISVHGDLRWFDDETPDLTWDAIWEGKATKTEEGWTAEFKIPFRELRFSSDDIQNWGIQIHRRIAETNEELYWTDWSRNESGYVRHFADLKGIKNIPKQTRLSLTPYLISKYTHDVNLINPVHTDNFDLAHNIGLDVKYGVSNNLTLDLTLNPDFGQIEADPAELNLSGFESYFSERRPFFIEGGNIYNFSLGVGDDNINTLFYTRRIGRRPHDAVYPDSGYATNPSSTSILGAGKLSGKTNNGWSIGILNALTDQETSVIDYENDESEIIVVEPMTNYFVSRLQKDFNQGKSTMGGIFTSTNRRLKNTGMDWLLHDAYSAGLDFSHLFLDDSWIAQGTVSASNNLGSKDALMNLQTQYTHGFQRVGADHLSVDSTATHLIGFAGSFGLFKVKSDNNWRSGLGGWTSTPSFDPNEIGYHGRVDNKVVFLWSGFNENTPGKWYQSYNFNQSVFVSNTYGGEISGLGGDFNFNVTTKKYWSLGAGISGNGSAQHLTALRGGPSVLDNPKLNGWIWIGSDYRKSLNFGLNVWAGGKTDGVYWSGESFSVSYRPNDYFSLTSSTNYNQNHDTWNSWPDYEPYSHPDSGEDVYLMATMDQYTLSSTIRLDLTLTSDLSIQYYGAPFITTGKYYGFMKLIDTQAKVFDDRFYWYSDEESAYNAENEEWEIDDNNDGITDYYVPHFDFNYKVFNSNFVVRYEFKPGSSIYLVWSRGQEDFVNDGTFKPLSNLNNLLDVDPQDVFLIKVSTLLNL